MPEAKANAASQEKTEGSTRVAFELTPAMADEVERIMAMTDLPSRPEVFRRAFTLLRIHVDAASQNRDIYMVDPAHPGERYLISLPFTVKRDVRVAE